MDIEYLTTAFYNQRVGGEVSFRRKEFPGDEITFIFSPLAPAYKAGLTGDLPVKSARGLHHYLGSRLLFSKSVTFFLL